MASFVPRWGWVVSLHTNDFIKLDMFSSPLGDGVVHEKRKVNHKNNHDFRPRLGMGWFTYACDFETTVFRFSSPLGVGLVLDMDGTLANFYRFSSPLGDGLVQEHGTSYSYGEYFRPRSGLGWFTQYSYTCV